MNFGKAIELLKQGKAVYRDGWNGKGMFVVKQIPCTIGPDVIPGMQSLPQSAKEIIMSRENNSISYTNQMLIVNQDGRADSWVPSSSDVFAEDWKAIGYEDSFYTRMTAESDELGVRLDKLQKFLGSEAFMELDDEMQKLLVKQSQAMTDYKYFLDKRINLVIADITNVENE